MQTGPPRLPDRHAEDEQTFSIRLRPKDQARIEALRRSITVPAEVRITTTDIIRCALASAAAALPAELQDDIENQAAVIAVERPAKRRRARQERSAA